MFASFRVFVTHPLVKHTWLPSTRQYHRNLSLTTHAALGRENMFTSPHHLNASFTFQHIIFRSFAQRGPFKKPPPTPISKLDSVIRNNRITYPEMRVVYDDVTTGKTAWKIMKRGEALTFAKSKSLDLVLVKPPKGDEVPVCVLQDFKQRVQDEKKKAKEEVPKKKPKPMKEIRIGALCDTHDLNTKLNKVKGFLDEGLQVKVSIFAKKRIAREHPLALDETTLRVLGGLEDHAGPVQSVTKVSSRADFIISPLKN